MSNEKPIQTETQKASRDEDIQNILNKLVYLGSLHPALKFAYSQSDWFDYARNFAETYLSKNNHQNLDVFMKRGRSSNHVMIIVPFAVVPASHQIDLLASKYGSATLFLPIESMEGASSDIVKPYLIKDIELGNQTRGIAADTVTRIYTEEMYEFINLEQAINILLTLKPLHQVGSSLRGMYIRGTTVNLAPRIGDQEKIQQYLDVYRHSGAIKFKKELTMGCDVDWITPTYERIQEMI